MESISGIRENDAPKIPPFADSHMHFTVAGRPASAEELQHIITTYQQYGIFSLRDMGQRSGIGLAAKKMTGKMLEVRSAGYALFKKGGYGSFLGRGVSGEKEIREGVREIGRAGADFIKVINSGIVTTRGPGLVTEGGFSFRELKMIQEEALALNLGVACHANSDGAVRDAVRAGASSIEHGFYVSRETLHLMAESGTVWTPTAFALLSLVPLAAPSEGRYIEKVVDDHLASLQYAASIGVRLRVGSDSGSKGVRHGESFFAELRLWQKAGLTVEQILPAACMDRTEVMKGNYLQAGKDFISAGRVTAVFRNGIRADFSGPCPDER